LISLFISLSHSEREREIQTQRKAKRERETEKDRETEIWGKGRRDREILRNKLTQCQTSLKPKDLGSNLGIQVHLHWHI
jgi:hypothetical protein